MDDSRSSMQNLENGYIGDDDSISTNPSVPENSGSGDGWSEDEFDVRTYYLHLGFLFMLN